MVAGAPDSLNAQAPPPVGVYSNTVVAEEWWEPDRLQTLLVAGPTALDVRASTVLLSGANVTLPSPAFVGNETYTFKNIGTASSGLVVGGDTVDGVTIAGGSLILYQPGLWISLQSRGTGWVVVGGNREDNFFRTAVTPNTQQFWHGTVALFLGAPMVFNLLSIASIGAKRYTFVAVGATTATLTPNGADTIDGAASFALLSGDSVTLHSNPTTSDWNIVAVS
jgi:hypothetical protein